MNKRSTGITFIVIGLILMFVASIMMFGKTFVVYFDTDYVSYFRQDDIEIFKSIPFGLFGFGIISYLMGKTIKDDVVVDGSNNTDKEKYDYSDMNMD